MGLNTLDGSMSTLTLSPFKPELFSHSSLQPVFDQLSPGAPDIFVRETIVKYVDNCLQELLNRNSLVFFNSEPLVDFPRITSARVIEYGGVALEDGKRTLNQV